MYPTLFTIGSFNIPSYTVLIDLGLVLALALTHFEGRRLLHNGGLALDLGLWVVVGGIVGGRIGYVLVNWSAFAENWGQAVQIWEGGLNFHGAFLGGLAVLVAFSLLHRRDEPPITFWQLADVLTLGLALGLVFGWAACLMAGCAFGMLGEGIGFALLPDSYGIQAPRFATQAVGLAYALFLFAVFWLLRARWPFPGAAFFMFVLLYFSGHSFLEFTRGDEAIYLSSWRLPQVLDLVLVLLSSVALLAQWWKKCNENVRYRHEEGGIVN
jgi:phosphatidylglycerol:prolipoprotein diacylglycerol transferase